VKIILQTIHGELSVKEACEQLGIGPTQFANLRLQALQGMVDSIQPQPAGRPPRAHVATAHELELQQRLAELERENRVLKAQVEVSSLRRQQAVRSKSDSPAAKRPAPPRPNAAGGAVP
jgi:transposase-like protein